VKTLDPLRSAADNSRADSLAARLRQRRFRFFLEMLDTVPRPVRILDVGGSERFWNVVHPDPLPEVSVVVLNRKRIPVSRTNFSSQEGDARDMSVFKGDEFDVVFSNSVIEHVGKRQSQRRMADEIRRVGRRYFVQTPARSFPIEPHFLFPFFQHMPLGARTFLLNHFRLGWYPRIADRSRAREVADSIHLLSETDLRALFPGPSIYRERFAGLTKSITAYAGW
jgi:hypothetical protein